MITRGTTACMKCASLLEQDTAAGIDCAECGENKNPSRSFSFKEKAMQRVSHDKRAYDRQPGPHVVRR